MALKQGTQQQEVSWLLLNNTCPFCVKQKRRRKVEKNVWWQRKNFWQTYNLHLVGVTCCIMHDSSIEWGTYRNLEWHLPNHIGQHQLIVHHNNFIEPAAGVHTQEAESAWNNLKGPVEDRRGMPRKLLQSYLNDRMWRQWRGLDNIMANFWHVFTSNFTNYIG